MLEKIPGAVLVEILGGIVGKKILRSFWRKSVEEFPVETKYPKVLLEEIRGEISEGKLRNNFCMKSRVKFLEKNPK